MIRKDSILFCNIKGLWQGASKPPFIIYEVGDLTRGTLSQPMPLTRAIASAQLMPVWRGLKAPL